MELRTYLAIFWRRKWIVLVAVILSTIVATILTLLSTPVYASSTTLRIATVGSGLTEARTDISYSIRLMNTYATIITSSSARSEIRERLGLNFAPQISVDIVPDTELIRIRAEATSPQAAHDIAAAAADILITQNQLIYSGSGQTTQDILAHQVTQTEEELVRLRLEYESQLREDPNDIARLTAISQSIDLKERTYGNLLGQYEEARINQALRANQVSMVEPAYVPSRAAKPRHELNIILGVIVGFVIGAINAFVLDNLDTTLYTTQQIEAITQVPTVGKIPASREHLQIIRFDNGYQPELEAFRRLRTNILTGDREKIPRVLMITSAEHGEGKSTISANLAVTIAQSGRKVVIVDCDMRLPTIHTIFDQPNKRGLTNILVNNTPMAEAIQETVYPRVYLITSGSLPPNPTELLGSAQMGVLIEQLKEEYDMIILDTPALLSVSDAAVLVPYVDTAVLVVARTRSNRNAVQAVRQELNNVKVKSIGVVVNRAEKNGLHTY